MRILYVAPEPHAADPIWEQLIVETTGVEIDVSQTVSDAWARLQRDPSVYDLVLLGQDLSAEEETSLLRDMNDRSWLVAVVRANNGRDQQTAIEMLSASLDVDVATHEGSVLDLSGMLAEVVARVRGKQDREMYGDDETRYQSIIELAPDGIATLDLRGYVIACNTAFLKVTGFERSEIVGQHITRLPTMRGNDIKGYVQLLVKTLRGQRSGPIEFRWMRKDGVRRWGAAHISFFREGNKIRGVQAIVRDITERKRAAQLLHALNQAALAMERALTPDDIFAAVADQFQQLGLACVVLMVDEDQQSLVVTYLGHQSDLIRAAEKLTGLSAKGFRFSVDRIEHFARVVREKRTVFIQDARASVRQVLPDPIKGLAGQVVRIIHASRFIAAPLIAQERVFGILSVQSPDLTQDDVPTVTPFAHQMAAALYRAQLYEQAQQEIAERMRAEEALRESEERFRALVQHSSDIIVVLDSELKIHYVSPSAERVLGFAPAYFVGRDPFELLHTKDVPSTRARLSKAIAQPGTPVVHRFRIQDINGDWKIVETVTVSLLNDASVQGVVINARDVTEREHLEQQFRQAQKMEAVGRLAGGIAHDFNNLLTAVQGYADLSLRRLRSVDRLDRSGLVAIEADVQEIRKAAERAASLTNQLLAFSRKQMLQPKVLDLNRLVRGIRNMLQRLIGEDITLSTNLDPRLGRVMADPGQIEQVILNLVVNARDAMPHGGRLEIATSNVDLSHTRAAVNDELPCGSYVVLSVRDNGVGMDEDVQSHLFEPFFTTKEVGKGTGLGLATVYGIVKQSEGHIVLDSEPDAGTTFEVYLPRVGVEGETDGAGTSWGDVASGSETVLLVEDESVVRDLSRRILDMQGYTVLEAEHAEAALEICAVYTGAIDLLITDVVMPGLGGRDLAERVVHMRPDIKIIYISGYTDDAIVQHGVLRDDVRLVQKPFTPSVLAKHVRQVLDG